MPPKKKSAAAKILKKKIGAPRGASTPPPLPTQVASILAALKRLGSARVRGDMSKRYGIVGPIPATAFGVMMSDIQKVAKGVRHEDPAQNHALAAALWETGQYEAQLLTAFIDDPALVTPAQMDRWAKDFDNWGTCDTLCFKLFDRSPHAAAKVVKWSKSQDEFVRRAGFALMACLALHDNAAPDAVFLAFLPLIEQYATDDRNFVKKAVNWALRAIGRGSAARKGGALAVAQRLAASPDATASWIGKDALRQFARPAAGRSGETGKKGRRTAVE